MKIVLDTSAALHVALQGEKAAVLMTALEQASHVLSPSLIHAELGNALWKYMRWQSMPHMQALEHYSDAINLIDEVLEETSLMPQALRLAAQHEHPVYDLLFVTAALQHGAKLLTLDQKLKSLALKIDADLIM